MVRTTVVALIFAAVSCNKPANGQEASATPSAELSAKLDWIVAHAPDGIDITPDGTIWVNITKVGQKDDYAIRADDLYSAHHTQAFIRNVWVRGYHKRNPSVTYRESKARYSINCRDQTIRTSAYLQYDGEGQVLWEAPRTYNETDIIPGSLGERYYRMTCLDN